MCGVVRERNQKKVMQEGTGFLSYSLPINLGIDSPNRNHLIPIFLVSLLCVLLFLVMVCRTAESKEPVWSYSDNGRQGFSVSISEDNDYIAAGYGDDVCLFERESNVPLWTYETGSYAYSVAISSDGEYIAAGSWDDNIYIFEKDDGDPIQTYSVAISPWSVAISSDGEYTVAGAGQYVYLFDKDLSSPIWSYKAGDEVVTVDISGNGNYIVAGSEDDNVYLFSKSSGTPLKIWTDSDSKIHSVSISADGEYIAAGAYDTDNTVFLFDKDETSKKWSYNTGFTDVNSVAISSDGNFIVAGTTTTKKVFVFAKGSSTPLKTWTVDDKVRSVSISGDGDYCVVGTGDYGHNTDQTLYFFDRTDADEIWKYTAHDDVISVCISDDGEYIIAGEGMEQGDYMHLFTRNDKPEAHFDSISPNPANEGDEISFQGNWTDDGSIKAYDWDSTIDGDLSSSEDFSMGYEEFTQGTHTIRFRVQDNNDVWSDWNETSLKINKKPSATINDIEPSPATYETDTINFKGTGTDTDGNIAAYVWRSSEDGQLSTSRNFSKSASQFSTGMHTIYFKVQDNNGAWSTEKSRSLEINKRPVATINNVEPSPAIYESDTIYFNGTGSDTDGSIAAYNWRSSEDGPLSTSRNFSKSASQLSAGTHTIYFKVQDNDGAWSLEKSKSLEINKRPVATIDDVEPSSAIYESDTVYFNGTGTDTDGSISAYNWRSSEDGQLSTSRKFSKAASQLSAGTHTIYFKVQDNDGAWSLEKSKSLEINKRPVATIDDVEPSPAIYESDTVYFNGTGTDTDGSISAYNWRSSEDGQLSTSRKFSKAANQLSAGTHTIYFKVQDNDGAWSLEKSKSLEINKGPVATIDEVEPSPATYETDTVYFNGTGTDTDGSITAYNWRSSEDGQLSTSRKFSKAASQLSAGTQTIYFKVQDDDGVWSAEKSKSLEINKRPTASINEVEPSPAIYETDTVYFNGTGTDTDGSVTGYNWRSSEDGQLSTSRKFSKAANQMSSGTHTIYFKVKDNDGAWSLEKSKTLKINKKPVATIDDLEPSPAIYESDTVYFNGTGTDTDGSIAAYNWRSSEDGQLSTSKKFSKAASQLSVGTHIIYFKVKDDDGVWSSEKSKSLEINKRPVATIDDLEPSPAIYENETVYFNGTGTDTDGSIAAYNWRSSEDGQLSTSRKFSKAASKMSVGTHTIYFKVQDNDGVWSPEKSKTLKINKRPIATIDDLEPSPATHGNDTVKDDIVYFNGTGTDNDGSVNEYMWRSNRSGFLSNKESFTLNASELPSGDHNISFKVKDDDGAWSSIQYGRLTIISENYPPIAKIISITPNPAYSDTDDIIFFKGTGEDHVNDTEGNIVLYVWYYKQNGTTLFDSPTTANFSKEAKGFDVGSHSVALKVKDDNGTWSTSVEATFVIKTEKNPPIIDSVDIDIDLIDVGRNWNHEVQKYNAIYQEETIHFRIFANDSDGSVVRYSANSSIDGEFYNDTQGEYQTSGLSIGTHLISIYCFDNMSIRSDLLDITIVVHERPVVVIHSISPKNALNTDTLVFNGSGSDDLDDVSDFTWDSNISSLISKDSNVSISASSLGLGYHKISFSCTDSYGAPSLIVYDYINITMKPTIEDWSIVPENGTTTPMIASLLFDIVFFEGTGLPENTIVNYSWHSDIDGQLSSSNNFSSDSLSIGIHTITFMVKDKYGHWSDSEQKTLVIHNRPTAIIDSPADNSTVLSSDEIQLKGSGLDDNDVEKLIYKWYIDDITLLGTAQNLTIQAQENIGPHVISLIVSDEFDEKSFPVQISITVIEVPSVNILSIAPNPVLKGEGKIIQFTGNNSAGDKVTNYQWVSDIDGIIRLSSEENFSINADTLSNGIHTITFSIELEGDQWYYAENAQLIIHNRPIATIDSPAVNSTFLLSDMIQLKGSGTDDNDVEKLIYKWYIDGVTLLGTAQNLTIFAGDHTGPHIISLIVTDEYHEDSIPFECPITVIEVPSVIIISIAPSPALKGEGEIIQFIGKNSVGDKVINYKWESNIDGIIKIGPEENISVNADLLSIGIHTITFSIELEGDLWSTTDSVELIIHTKPTAEILSISPLLVESDNDTVHFQLSGIDLDGNSQLTYRIISDIQGVLITRMSSDIEISGRYLKMGDHKITLRVKDNNDVWSDDFTYSELLSCQKPNSIPLAFIRSIYPNPSIYDSDTTTFVGDAIDDQVITDYRWKLDGVYKDWYVGKELVIPKNELEPGTYTASLVVTDDFGVSSDPVFSTFTIIEPNEAPVAEIISITPNPAPYHRWIMFEGRGVDPEGEDIISHFWQLDNGEIIGSRASFSILASDLAPGDYVVSYKVMDRENIWSNPVSANLKINDPPKPYEPKAPEVYPGDDENHRVWQFDMMQPDQWDNIYFAGDTISAHVWTMWSNTIKISATSTSGNRLTQHVTMGKGKVFYGRYSLELVYFEYYSSTDLRNITINERYHPPVIPDPEPDTEPDPDPLPSPENKPILSIRDFKVISGGKELSLTILPNLPPRSSITVQGKIYNSGVKATGLEIYKRIYSPWGVEYNSYSIGTIIDKTYEFVFPTKEIPLERPGVYRPSIQVILNGEILAEASTMVFIYDKEIDYGDNNLMQSLDSLDDVVRNQLTSLVSNNKGGRLMGLSLQHALANHQDAQIAEKKVWTQLYWSIAGKLVEPIVFALNGNEQTERLASALFKELGKIIEDSYYQRLGYSSVNEEYWTSQANTLLSTTSLFDGATKNYNSLLEHLTFITQKIRNLILQYDTLDDAKIQEINDFILVITDRMNTILTRSPAAYGQTMISIDNMVKDLNRFMANEESYRENMASLKFLQSTFSTALGLTGVGGIFTTGITTALGMQTTDKAKNDYLKLEDMYWTFNQIYFEVIAMTGDKFIELLDDLYIGVDEILKGESNNVHIDLLDFIFEREATLSKKHYFMIDVRSNNQLNEKYGFEVIIHDGNQAYQVYYTTQDIYHGIGTVTLSGIINMPIGNNYEVQLYYYPMERPYDVKKSDVRYINVNIPKIHGIFSVVDITPFDLGPVKYRSLNVILTLENKEDFALESVGVEISYQIIDEDWGWYPLRFILGEPYSQIEKRSFLPPHLTTINGVSFDLDHNPIKELFKNTAGLNVDVKLTILGHVVQSFHYDDSGWDLFPFIDGHIEIFSPVDIIVTNEAGESIGKNETSIIIENESSVYYDDDHRKYVGIPVDQSYMINLRGYDYGSYKFQFTYVNETNVTKKILFHNSDVTPFTNDTIFYDHYNKTIRFTTNEDDTDIILSLNSLQQITEVSADTGENITYDNPITDLKFNIDHDQDVFPGEPISVDVSYNATNDFFIRIFNGDDIIGTSTLLKSSSNASVVITLFNQGYNEITIKAYNNESTRSILIDNSEFIHVVGATLEIQSDDEWYVPGEVSNFTLNVNNSGYTDTIGVFEIQLLYEYSLIGEYEVSTRILANSSKRLIVPILIDDALGNITVQVIVQYDDSISYLIHNLHSVPYVFASLDVPSLSDQDKYLPIHVELDLINYHGNLSLELLVDDPSGNSTTYNMNSFTRGDYSYYYLPNLIGVHNISLIVNGDEMMMSNSPYSTVIVGDIPDLTMKMISWSYSHDGKATINATIWNVGNGAVNDISIQYFDGHPDYGGTPLGNRTLSSLAGKSEDIVLFDFKMMKNVSKVYISIDELNTIQEYDEFNNLEAIFVYRLPDIQITELNHSISGNDIKINVIIENRGDIDMINTTLYCEILSGDKKFMDFENISYILPGMILNFSFTFENLSGRNYTCNVFINMDDHILEIEKDKNSVSIQFDVKEEESDDSGGIWIVILSVAVIIILLALYSEQRGKSQKASELELAREQFLYDIMAKNMGDSIVEKKSADSSSFKPGGSQKLQIPEIIPSVPIKQEVNIDYKKFDKKSLLNECVKRGIKVNWWTSDKGKLIKLIDFYEAHNIQNKQTSIQGNKYGYWYCSKCGNQIGTEKSFCAKCGNKRLNT